MEPVLLDTHCALRIDLQKGERIVAGHGTLWVTVTGDPVDYVLGPGEAFTPEGLSAEVVLEAIGGTASFRVRPPVTPVTEREATAQGVSRSPI